MSGITDKIKMSREAGYNDKEILDFLGQFPEYKDKVSLSRKLGREDKDIIDFLSQDTTPAKEQISPMDVPALVAKGAGESVYDLAAAPYALAGADTGKLRDSIFKSAPTASGPIGKLAEGAGQGVGATLPGIGVGKILETAGAKLAKPALETAGKFLADSPKTQMATGAVGGAVDEATGQPGTGAAASAAIPVAGSLGRKIANPNLSHLAGDQARLRQLAEQMGIPLTAADKTGNKVLHQAEAVMRTLPGSAGVMQGVDKTQREAFNNAVLKVAGIDKKYATTEVLDRAHKKIGMEMDALAQLSNSTLDKQWATDVDRVAFDQGRRLETDPAPVFKSYMDDLDPWLQAARTGQPVQITGERYDEVRKGIAARARKTKDPALRDALHGLMDSLDGAMERTSRPILRDLWKDARRRYAALSTLENAMSGGTAEDRQIGNIPFTGFKQATATGDKRGYARGQGQYNDLARVGEFLAPKVPTSGTAERSNMMRMMKGGGLAAAGGAAMIDPLTTGAVAATGVGLPYGIAKAYNSDPVTNWLSRQSVNNKGLVRTILEAMQAGGPQVAREATEKPDVQ